MIEVQMKNQYGGIGEIGYFLLPLFSGRIVCGQCGGFYGSKVWQCNHKFTNKDKCRTPHLYEEDIKKAFVNAINRIISNKNEILQEYAKIIDMLTDMPALNREDDKLREELEAVTALLRSCVDENARSALNQDEYTHKYSELKGGFDRIQMDITALSNKRMEYAAKRQAIAKFIQSLQKQEMEFVLKSSCELERLCCNI